MRSFILPINETTWRPAPESFARTLREAFTGVEIDLRKGWLSFEIPPEPYVEGEFKHLADAQSPAIIIDYGSPEGITAFCLWYRTLVPAEQQLLFCDEGMHFKLDLTPSTTAEDIKREVGWD